MVDISDKKMVKREAIAEGKIILKPATISLIREKKIEKGDPLLISLVSATNAVKRTPELVPFCHSILLEDIKVSFNIEDFSITVRIKVKSTSKTGVEIEALSGVLNALLNIWDVVKKYEKDDSGNYLSTFIRDVRVVSKVKGFEEL
jgi:cyclic pyranopterin phosphate synthase